MGRFLCSYVWMGFGKRCALTSEAQSIHVHLDIRVCRLCVFTCCRCTCTMCCIQTHTMDVMQLVTGSLHHRVFVDCFGLLPVRLCVCVCVACSLASAVQLCGRIRSFSGAWKASKTGMSPARLADRQVVYFLYIAGSADSSDLSHIKPDQSGSYGVEDGHGWSLLSFDHLEHVCLRNFNHSPIKYFRGLTSDLTACAA